MTDTTTPIEEPPAPMHSHEILSEAVEPLCDIFLESLVGAVAAVAGQLGLEHSDFLPTHLERRIRGDAKRAVAESIHAPARERPPAKPKPPRYIRRRGYAQWYDTNTGNWVDQPPSGADKGEDRCRGVRTRPRTRHLQPR